MKDILIVGAGGFGREVHGWAQSIPENGIKWKIVGYLDDLINRHDSDHAIEPPIIGNISSYQPKNNEELIIAIGDPRTRIAITKCLQGKGATFFTFIHPSVIIAPSAEIGAGVILCPNVVIGAYSKIGDFDIINVSSSVGHDAKIDKWVTISAHCDITGFASVGQGAFLGTHACVLPNVRLGAGTILGAGSVATRHLKPATTYFGIPAAPLPR